METETEILIKLIIEGNLNKINDYYDSKNNWFENIDCKIVTEKIKDVKNPIAYNILAYIYRKGKNDNIDKNKSFHYAKMSAKCDDGIGQYCLGHCYVEKKKYAKALHNFQLSAEKGYHKAHNSIGCLYYKGYGVEKNYEKAFYYFSLSAKINDECGQHNLGVLYLKGNGIERNNEKALKYFCSSYIGGYIESKFIIKYILSNICNIENYIFTIIDKNNVLEEENKCMEMENIELKYRPGNIGYYEARDDFYKIKY
jgi:TPR repeat protein